MYFLIARCFHSMRTHTVHVHGSQMLAVVLQLLSCFFIVAIPLLTPRPSPSSLSSLLSSSFFICIKSNGKCCRFPPLFITLFFLFLGHLFTPVTRQQRLATVYTYCINIITIIAQFKPSTRPSHRLNTNDIIYFITRFIHFKHGISKCKCALFSLYKVFSLRLLLNPSILLEEVQHAGASVAGMLTACICTFCFESHRILMTASNNNDNKKRERERNRF